MKTVIRSPLKTMKKTTLLLCFLFTIFLTRCYVGNYEGGLSYSGDPISEEDANHDQYTDYGDNPFVKADSQRVSTFSVDADGASYANVKRFIVEDKQLPPKAAVRIEEFINYFNMDYADPTNGAPIALNGEIADCPWQQAHQLIRIGIKGKSIPVAQLPPANWVLLIDVSGSMTSDDKLPLVVKGFKLFVENTMRANDRLAIVTYAGEAGTALESTSGKDKSKILKALDKLKSGGSTNGEGGINKAYDIALANFFPGGNNRIILATDGDFNVGISSQSDLIQLIEEKRDKGVFLTTIGVGRGNYNDAMLEQLANNGNGTAEYIGDEGQARKVLVNEFNRFYTVAKDVKVQVEFNPQIVRKWRLIGYENRVLNAQDFTDDKKDAGEIGAGQTVTALYEIELQPQGGTLSLPTFKIDFRYKAPDADISDALSLDIYDEHHTFAQASESMRFAAATAAFGMLLRDSPYKGNVNYDQVLDWTKNAKSYNPFNYKDELLEMMNKAKSLK